MRDHDAADSPIYRAGFLAPFITGTIGTFALLASTVVRSAASLAVTLALSVTVGLAAGLLASLLRRHRGGSTESASQR